MSQSILGGSNGVDDSSGISGSGMGGAAVSAGLSNMASTSSNSGIRAALGKLFTWKFSILLSVIVLSVLFYRPFCKWLCPLGAFYALFNRVSLFQMKVDKSKCVSCGKCARACKMDVDVTKTPNHTECIRCGMCIRACPTNAVCFRYGFGDGKEKENAATLRENNKA